MLQGDKIHGLALGEASLATWRQLGNNWGIALALNLMGSCADALGQTERGVALLEESLTLSRAVDDPWCLSLVLGNLAATLMDHGNYARAKSLAEEEMALGQSQGLEYTIAIASMHPGCCIWQAGDYDAARSYFEESLACHRRCGDRRQCGNALYGLGILHGCKAMTRRQQHATPKVWRWHRKSATNRWSPCSSEHGLPCLAAA